MKQCLFVLMAVALSLCACSSIDCPLQNTVRTLYVLKKPNAEPDTLKDTLSIYTLRADGTDTLLLNAGIKLSTLSLPIGYANPEDTLVFYFRNDTFLALDTVWLRKDNYPHFESVDCNASFFHDITAVRSTHNAIDSIVINNPSVTYDPETEHFHLYLKSRH